MYPQSILQQYNSSIIKYPSSISTCSDPPAHLINSNKEQKYQSTKHTSKIENPAQNNLLYIEGVSNADIINFMDNNLNKIS